MSIETIPAPAMPVAAGTYTIDAQADANYTTTAGTITGNDKTLALRIFWPDVADPTIPLPLVVYTCTLGWSLSPPTAVDSIIEDYFLGAGCIAVSVGTRIISDEPLSVGESASMSSTRRAMNAAVLDLNTALRYVLANYSEHANGIIEPSMVFLAGTSAGAITSMAYTYRYPSHPIAGVINFSGAFGLAVAANATIMRGELNMRETYYRAPTCAFLGGADATIGSTYIDLLRTKLALQPSNTTHYDADGTHVGPADFDVTALTGASTVGQAVANFLLARCTAISPVATQRKNAATWRKNWYRQESRYQ